MSKPGTTWFKSKRKLVVLVAGAAILAGTVGVAAPAHETELAKPSASVAVQDSGLDADVRIAPNLRFSFSSTWS